MPNQFLSDEFGDIEDYFVTDYRLIDNFVGDTLFTWGTNNDPGILGINVTSMSTRNTPVTTFSGGTNWKQVSTGRTHTAAIKTDGSLWIWGEGAAGRLGTNNTANRITPVTTFVGGNNWKQVPCGGDYTAAIKTDGSLWTWGGNTFGQLGTNNTTQQNAPVTTFAGGTNWKSVSASTTDLGATGAIKTDGSLWAWGYGRVIGINDTNNKVTPVTTSVGGTTWKQVATGRTTMAIKTDGTLWQTQNDAFTFTQEVGGNNWKFISVTGDTGGVINAAIKTDGTLWTWGRNNTGALGTNDNVDRGTPVTTFAGGTNWKSVSICVVNNDTGKTAAIKTDGTLWTWGWGGEGALGNFANANRSTPVTTFAGGTNWKQVSVGGVHMAAVKSGLNVDLS